MKICVQMYILTFYNYSWLFIYLFANFAAFWTHLRNSFKSVKTYPGADIGSDHNPLVGVFATKQKKLLPSNIKTRIEILRLRDQDTKRTLHCVLNNKFHELQKHMRLQMSITSPEPIWSSIRDTIVNTAKETLTPASAVKSKELITDDILNLMTRSRLAKHTNSA